ncbi:unnamed protein product [Closterium sp. NIES-53]
MATPRVLRFDAEADPAPLADDPTPANSDRYAPERADVTAWKSHDAAACIALSSLLPESEETHFTQVRTASEFPTAIKARYATPTTISLGRLFLMFLFPDLASFERTADLIIDLRSLDSSYRAACTDAQLALLPPPIAITIYFIATSLPDRLASVRDTLLLKHPSELTIEVPESALKEVESNLLSVASAFGVVPPPLFHGRGGQGAGGGGGGDGGDMASGGGGSAGTGGATRTAAGDSPAAFGGGDAQVHQPPTGLPAAGGGAAACLGASLAEVPVASVGTCVDISLGASLAAPEDTSLSFTLDSGALHCFFRDRTTLTPIPTPVSVALADPTLGPVTARYTTTLPCPAVPSGSLTGFHVPSFSRNLVGVRPLVSQHVGVWIEPSGEIAGSSSSSSGSNSYCPRPLSLSPVRFLRLTRPPACLAIVAAFACAILQSLRRGSAARHPSLLLPSSGHRALRDSPLGRMGPASRPGPERESFFLVVIDDYSRYTTVLPLAKKSDVTSTLIQWLLTTADTRARRVSCLHSNCGGEFGSGILVGFCREQGIRHSWTLQEFPKHDGVAERHIGLVMEIARTSMTHAQVSPTSLWTGSPGVASRFRVWGCLALVRDTSADKISPCAVPCVFPHFPEDSSDYTFCHPPLHRFFVSRDVRFDKSVPYYVRYPCQGLSVPPAPLFLTSAPPPAPPVQPPPPGPALFGVSHATPPPSVAPQVQLPSPQSSS